MSLEETLLDVRAVIGAYFDAINSERYDDVAQLFAEDGILIAPGMRPRQGRDDIAAYFPKVLARYPEHFDDATRVLVDGRAAAVEIDFTGKLDTGDPIAFGADRHLRPRRAGQDRQALDLVRLAPAAPATGDLDAHDRDPRRGRLGHARSPGEAQRDAAQLLQRAARHARTS